MRFYNKDNEVLDEARTDAQLKKVSISTALFLRVLTSPEPITDLNVLAAEMDMSTGAVRDFLRYAHSAFHDVMIDQRAAHISKGGPTPTYGANSDFNAMFGPPRNGMTTLAKLNNGRNTTMHRTYLENYHLLCLYMTTRIAVRVEY